MGNYPGFYITQAFFGCMAEDETAFGFALRSRKFEAAVGCSSREFLVLALVGI